MDLDANSLLASMLVSTIGVGFLIYGKRQSRLPQLVGGLLLSVFPYFISAWWLILLIGALLTGLIVLAARYA